MNEAYQKQRIPECQNKPICLAPFVNLYFKSVGDVAPCWRYSPANNQTNRHPEKTLQQIWDSAELKGLRQQLTQNILPKTCQDCAKNLQQGEFKTYLGSHYDSRYPLDDYPKIMEFELSNTCDLECIMCNGNLSSMIRKNREKKPQQATYYDQNFVHQLIPFIPHLEEARFNGGEPFLIEIYYSIWQKMLELKPSIKIDIATNGTVIGNRAKNILEKGAFNINLSLDSLQKESYEMIRKNASFKVTMRNLEYLRDYCQRKKSHFLIVINPMRINWQEMPDFVNFGNKHNIPIAFNTIQQPEELSLWALPYAELNQVYEKLRAQTPPTNSGMTDYQKYNISIYEHLVQVQIYNWLMAKKDH